MQRTTNLVCHRELSTIGLGYYPARRELTQERWAKYNDHDVFCQENDFTLRINIMLLIGDNSLAGLQLVENTAVLVFGPVEQKWHVYIVCAARPCRIFHGSHEA